MAITQRAALTAAFEIPEQVRKQPGTKILQVPFIAHAAATATEDIAELVMPHAAKIVGAYIVPAAAVTGANTNYTSLILYDRGTDGTGTTALATLALTSGNDLVAKAKNIMSEALTTTVVAGQVLGLSAAKSGTGLDVPAGTLVVAYVGA